MVETAPAPLSAEAGIAVQLERLRWGQVANINGAAVFRGENESTFILSGMKVLHCLDLAAKFLAQLGRERAA